MTADMTSELSTPAHAQSRADDETTKQRLPADLDRNLRIHHIMMARSSVLELMQKPEARQIPLLIDLAEEISWDFSKHPIDDETLGLLGRLLEAQGVAEKRDAMFAGEAVNTGEQRAALHVALRAPRGGPDYHVDGHNVSDEVHQVLDRMQVFCDSIHAGQRLGATGKRFTHVINIGIGGSDLGPRMVCQALKDFADQGIEARFVSNVDPSDLHHVLRDLPAERCLFVIASKTFTTQETLTNARAARAWLEARLPDANTDGHFVAVTAAPDTAATFGINEDNIFPFWDWVGGRYSMWSAIGLPIALTLGFARFRAFLDGAHAADEHFQTQSFTQNIPMLMGALAFWYRNYWDAGSHAVLPYDQNLEALPAYLQQLEMESNGKTIGEDGLPTAFKTAPVMWGAAGTNAQHSFFQCLHQGKDTIPMDMLAAARSNTPDQDQHRLLLANFLAQGQAFAEGQSESVAKQRFLDKGYSPEAAERAARFSHIPGNRPVSMVIYPRMRPWVLGALIALYEHRVFVQAALAGINPFDQWGVELGKVLAKSMEPALVTGDAPDCDPATKVLLDQLRHWQSAQG